VGPIKSFASLNKQLRQYKSNGFSNFVVGARERNGNLN